MSSITVEKRADVLFEASWEVCNKVGGIYTVVKSKVQHMLEFYDSGYYLIGPYFPNKVHGEFEEKVPPVMLKAPFDALKNEGIHCHYGTWLVPGNPNTVLIDFAGFIYMKDRLKSSLWENFNIDSLGTDFFDYDESIVWCAAVARLLQEVARALPDKKLVAHFHEWLAGTALLHLKMSQVLVPTVFTTHATMLGRTLAGNDVDLYAHLDKTDADKEAYRFGIAAKHHTERQCAQQADVFTTVSEITGMEAQSFFGRAPDILVHNGLDVSKFPTFEESTIRHRLFKSRIQEFLLYYFFPYYSFDIEEALLYFVCGRYEFHAKGLDVLIKSLGMLNSQLRKEKQKTTVVCFFWVPGNIRGIKPSLLECKTFFTDVKDSVEESMEQIKHKLLQSVVAEKKVALTTLFDRSVLDDIHKKLLKLKRDGQPPVSTHDLYDEEKDLILRALAEVGLTNKKEDRVKIVFYPIYLTGADSLLDTAYYESMQGCHLGIFPSYYEPWGYTPLECAALGVPALTTDLAGFGRYMQSQLDPKQPGIFVLPRLGKSDDDVVAELASTMYKYSKLSKEQRVQTKIQAKKLAACADWKTFVEFYIQAHNLALERRGM